jgi:LysR family glycine cleavage system transcriptional activator
MRRSLIPSLHALIAFESAARYGGIMRAADELHLSQSAVSRLVKQVEDAIQVKLFDRVRQRLILTEAGRAYSRQMHRVLGEIEQATLQVMAYGSGGRSGTLNLGVFSTFGTKWLIPRLETYKERQPNIVISCYARPRLFSFDDDPLDGAIHYGDAIWPGAIVEPLFGEHLVPVVSPHLQGIHNLKKAKDILSFPLLHEVTRPWAWNRWLEQEGVVLENSLPGARFDQFNMVAQAAKVGLGIGLVPRFLFEAEIASKELFVPFNRPIFGEYKYYFVYPHRNSANAIVLDFKDWLLETARGERMATSVGESEPNA